MHVLRSLQGIRQSQQDVLLRQLASAGSPEVVNFAGQLRADVPV